MTIGGTCQFCEHPSPSGKSVCTVCITDIVGSALAGENMRLMAERYNTTKNAMISMFNRYKPEGTKHPGGSVYAPRPPKPIQVMVVTADIYDPPKENPRDPVGCRFIEAELEDNWSYCQAEQQRGSSYCTHHHARVWVSPAKAKADRHAAEAAGTATKFTPHLSRRTAVQAYQ